MKKILIIGIILIVFISCINVQAEDNYFKFEDDSYNLMAVQKVCNAGDQINFYTSTNIDTSKSFYYKIDNQEYVKLSIPASIEVKITEDLLKEAEHKITIYADVDGERTEEKSIDFLLVNKESCPQNVSYDIRKLNLSLINFPINTKMTVNELGNDENLLKKFNLSTADIFQIRFNSNEKDLKYYQEKYGKYLYSGFNNVFGTISGSSNIISFSDEEGNRVTLFGYNANGEKIMSNFDDIEPEKCDNIYNLDYSIYDPYLFIDGYMAFAVDNAMQEFSNSNVNYQEPNPKTGNYLGLGIVIITLFSVFIYFIIRKRNFFQIK